MLISVLVTLIVIGVLMWLVNEYIPMAISIKKIFNVVSVIAVVCWLINVFGYSGTCLTGFFCSHILFSPLL